MSLFKSQVHQDVWIEHHCHRCWHYEQACPIIYRALRTGRKPVQWDRNPRKGALMAETMKCNEQTTRPPRKPVLDLDVPMFDVTPTVLKDSDHA